MSGYGAARQSRSTETSSRETINTVARRSVRTAQQEDAFANIQANTFHKIIVQSQLSPEKKMEEAAKALEFSGTREENRARINRALIVA